MKMAFWPPMQTRQPTVQREFRGISILDPFSLSDIYATDSKNTSSIHYPALSVRPGTTQVSYAATKVLGMGVWKDKELHVVFDDGTWRRLDTNGWAILASDLNRELNWCFTNFKGNLSDISLIGANGIDAVRYYDGNTVQILPSAPVGLNYIEQYADRLWGVKGNTLYYTAYRMANDWTAVNQDDADSGNIEIETPNGEQINGLISNSTSLTITKPSSQHKLFGTSASDYAVRTVTREIGVYNNNCLVNIEGVLYEMDNTGIYNYSGSTLPDKSFCLPVQRYIDQINPVAAKTACLGSDGKRLYAAIPLHNSSSNDTILVYDFIARSWDVWDAIRATCFAKVNGEIYIGDTFGGIWKLGSSTDNGYPIKWWRVSVPYGAASLSQKIRLKNMWIVANVPAGSTLNIYLSKQDSGDNDWLLVKSVPADAVLESTRIIIPTTAVANANWIRVKFEGTGPCEIKEFARETTSMPIR